MLEFSCCYLGEKFYQNAARAWMVECTTLPFVVDILMLIVLKLAVK